MISTSPAEGHARFRSGPACPRQAIYAFFLWYVAHRGLTARTAAPKKAIGRDLHERVDLRTGLCAPDFGHVQASSQFT
jgi:hypothetical protein